MYQAGGYVAWARVVAMGMERNRFLGYFRSFN